MATAESPTHAPRRHDQTSRAQMLALLVHLGLLAICLSAVQTVQPPTFSARRFLALGVVAVAALLHLVLTRARGAFTETGKALTALLAGVALSLSYDPQLANLPGLGERLPLWLSDLNPSLATVGVLWAAFWGIVYLATVHRHHGWRAASPYLRPVLLAGVLVAALGVVTFLALSRVYELDSMYVGLLVSQSLQYVLLLAVALAMSGRVGVGGVAQGYLALAILAAVARHFMGGGEAQ